MLPAAAAVKCGPALKVELWGAGLQSALAAATSLRAVFYLFLLVLAALAVGIYLLFFMQNVPGAKEERIGVLEPLPSNLGEWREETSGPAAEKAASEGLRREERTYFDEAHNRLLKQVRYRSSTGEIVRSEPDEVIRRRRVTR